MEFEKLEVRRYHPTETGIAYIVPVSDEEGYGTTEVAVSYLADPNGDADSKQRAAYAHLFAAAPELLDLLVKASELIETSIQKHVTLSARQDMLEKIYTATDRFTKEQS